MIFDLAKVSISSSQKSKCGDFYDSFDISAENLLILTLADGVGSCVCDWKASQTTCTEFIKNFVENISIENIEQRIIDSVQKVESTILGEDGFCKGMKSTFVGVVWDYKNHIIYYTGIGDSRIYLIEKETVKQITKDETATIIRKGMDGKPLIYAGVTVVGEGVTNVIGALVSCQVFQIEDKNTEGVLLASDGFYNCKSSFEEDVKSIFNSMNMDSQLEKVIRHYKDYQKDDMTVLIARKKINAVDLTEQIVNKVLSGEVNEIPKYQIIYAMLEQLSKSIDFKKSEISQKIIKYCEINNIQFDQKDINEMIGKMVRLNFQDSVTYRGLVNMLRKIQF